MGAAKDAAKESIKFGAFGSALELLTRKAQLEKELEEVERKLEKLRRLWDTVSRQQKQIDGSTRQK